MPEFFNNLLSSEYLPHGHCYHWQPGLVWLQVLSDGAIVLAYFSIPAALWYFVRRRTDLEFRWVFVLFAMFILACGTTHLLGIWTLWHPHYWLDGTVKAFTGAVSLVTAVLLWPLIPKLLSLPSPRQMAEANEKLRIEVEERKVVEREVRELNTELERRVRERTRQLGRSNEDLQRFAYVASHDLQEPLRIVSSYVQLLKRRYAGKLDSDADEFIGYAVDGCQRMQGLIRDLLDFSRIETRGRDFTSFSLDQVLERAKSNLSVSVEETGASIEAGPLPEVSGDPTQIMLVFQNMLSNAMKYRGEEAPEIRVDAEKIEQDGEPWWKIMVRDNGIGFDPIHADRIFEMFQRLHPKGSYPGTGMGLAICKRVVERHGGSIGADSEPGRGSTFWFTLQ